MNRTERTHRHNVITVKNFVYTVYTIYSGIASIYVKCLSSDPSKYCVEKLIKNPKCSDCNGIHTTSYKKSPKFHKVKAMK